MRRPRAVAAAAVLMGVLGAGGCSPPEAPLDVRIKDIPTDVNIGQQATTSVPSTVVTTAARP